MNLVDMRTAPPRHLWKTWHPRTQPITHVVIHHSATPPTQSIYSMAWYHVNTKDMPSIQYHYVVQADGQVCWMNDDELLVWHGNGSNDYAIGVCLVGDFTHEHPPEAQLQAARELIAHLETKHGRALDVIGHKEAPRAATACPGDTWDEWKGELRMTETNGPQTRTSKLGLHYQLLPGWSDKVRVPWVKLIDPPAHNSWPWAKVIGRVWIGGDGVEQELIWQGAAGAQIYYERCRDRYERAPYVHAWEGPNEPQPMWDQAFRAKLVEFTVEWDRLMKAAGRRTIGGCFSVGWPDIGHAREFRNMCAVVDYLGLREYGAPAMWDNAGWHCLRYRRTIQELRDVGARVPLIIIGECGIDGGVLGRTTAGRGWKSYATRAQFKEQLAWFDDEICEDDEVECATTFVSGPNRDWVDFDIDEDLARWIEGRHTGAELPAEPPLAEIIADAQRYIIPRTPGHALYEAGVAEGYYEASGEFDVDDWRCQAFRDPADAQLQHIAYCLMGDWGNIRWVTVDNETHEIVA